MRKFILWGTLALSALGGGGLLHAAEVLGFYLYPDSSISGAAGSTVGWAFYIENSDAAHWMSITSVTPQFQSNPSLMTGFVDFLSPLGGNSGAAIAPLDYWWITDFDLGSEMGVGAYTINGAALVGAADSGILRLSYDVYDGDPLNGGSYVESILLDVDVSPSYELTVSGTPIPPSEVPEPSTAMLSLPVALLAIVLHRRRQQQIKE